MQFEALWECTDTAKRQGFGHRVSPEPARWGFLILSKDRPLLYYRLGIARDQKPLLEASSDVDGIIVGGHIFAWGRSWISVFLRQMDKPFLIDPMTYVFAKDPSFILKDGEPRKSFGELKGRYGPKVDEVAGKRPLRPVDFGNGKDSKMIREFTKQVMEFQRETPRMSDTLQSSLKKYGEIAGEDYLKTPVLPQLFLAPYFHATDTTDPWYGITLECARAASELGEYEPVIPVLCISESFVTASKARERMCEDLSGFDCCALWVSGLNEHVASVENLNAFKSLMEGLRDKGVETINLYGGHLSLLLHGSGIAVTCSGAGYGESKSADQVATGGGFPDRYYLPGARSSVVEANARAFLARNPGFLCTCQACKDLSASVGMDTESSEFSTQLDRFFQDMRGALARVHYIRCRGGESAHIGDSDFDALKEELNRDESELRKANSSAFGVPADHLGRWASML